VATQDPKVQSALGLDPTHDKVKKHASQAIRNLLRRMEGEGRPITDAVLHGAGGVEQAISRTPETSAKRREAQKRRDDLERSEKGASFATRVLAGRREQDSAEAKKRLEKEQKPEAKKITSKAKAAMAGPIVPMAGQARKLRQLPTTTKMPSKPMETGATVRSKHGDGMIRRYQIARSAFEKLKGRLEVDPQRRAAARRDVANAGRALKSVGLNPHNLPKVGSFAPPQGKPVPVAQPGRAPHWTGAQTAGTKEAPTPAFKAQERANKAGPDVVPVTSEKSAVKRVRGKMVRTRVGSPEPSEQQKRARAESEHQTHLNAVKKHEPLVQSVMDAKLRLDAKREAHKDNPNHENVKRAGVEHAKHVAALKKADTAKEIDFSKLTPNAPSPSQEREERKKNERKERAETPSGAIRTTGPVPVRQPLTQQPKPKPKKPSFETPAAFKMAGVMKSKPGKKLFVPSPEQRQTGTYHAGGGGSALNRTPLGPTRRPDESPDEHTARVRKAAERESLKRSAREARTEPPRSRPSIDDPAPPSDREKAEKKRRGDQKSPAPLKIKPGDTHRTPHDDGGHIETTHEKTAAGSTYRTSYIHPERGFLSIGSSSNPKQAAHIHHNAVDKGKFSRRVFSNERPQESLLVRSNLRIQESQRPSWRPTWRPVVQRRTSFYEKVCALA